MRNETMKQLPPQERPYEKCVEKGPAALTDRELVAVLLRTGSDGKNALELAGEVLRMGREKDQLAGFCRLSFRDLTKIKGIGRAKAVQLLCAGELSKRLARTRSRTGPYFRNAGAVAEYYMEALRHETREHVVVMMLDTKGRFLGEKWMFAGTATASVASPRELFAEALRYDATNIILIHNHPSGDPQPSSEDILLTGRMRKCGQMLDIPLTDHIIIGDMRYTSFREQGFLDQN